jgi:hypothetical protein
LGFVQDVINTRPTHRLGVPELLADLESAQRWLDEALANWSLETGVPQSAVILSEDDVDKLRDFRADLSAFLRNNDQGLGTLMLPSASLAARMGPDGVVLLDPRGEGTRRVGSIVLIEAFTAQRMGTWRRLKVCRNDRCAACFYDHSRNNSGVWDGPTCGNAINLRASRARRRQRQLGAAHDAGQANQSGAK